MISNKLAIFIAAALALAVTLPATPAQAQAARTFVSAAGSDSNNCTNVASPCRHFATAYAATAAEGEIDVLDPANYGQLTISHGISVQGHGWASVSAVTGGASITINGGDKINISGVILDGGGAANSTGIQFNSGGILTVSDSVVRNFSGSGIALTPNSSAHFAVSNTLVANNGVHGIYLQPSGSGTVSAVFNRVEAYSNGQEGIGIFGNSLSSGGVVEATAVDSVAAFNNDGFYALGSSSAFNTDFFVFRSTTVRNVRSAIRGEQFAIVHVSSSHLEAGGVWAQSSGGCVASFGDNIIDQAAPCGTVIGKN